MPKFKIYRSFGRPDTRNEKVIEAETLKEAEGEAWEYALDMVDSWAEPVEEGTEDE